MKKERNRTMKCPRCKQTMRRRKKDNGYFYYCPACRFVVNSKTHVNRSPSVADGERGSKEEQ